MVTAYIFKEFRAAGFRFRDQTCKLQDVGSFLCVRIYIYIYVRSIHMPEEVKGSRFNDSLVSGEPSEPPAERGVYRGFPKKEI